MTYVSQYPDIAFMDAHQERYDHYTGRDSFDETKERPEGRLLLDAPLEPDELKELRLLLWADETTPNALCGDWRLARDNDPTFVYLLAVKLLTDTQNRERR